MIVLGAAAYALRSQDRSGGNFPQELYNTTMKALPDGLNAMPTSYAEVKRETITLERPLPGDLGATIIGREREPVPTDHPFRYQPAQSSKQVQPSEAARTSKLFFIVHQSGGIEQEGSPSTTG